jgi:MoaA/NifB/PqqE/SkfB family radical SAM enzyme
MANKLREYLQDPFLDRLYTDIRNAGALKAISLDVTHVCNLRCQGCFFFAEAMDEHKAPEEAEFDAFIQRELARGTNYVTLVGGEPSLMLQRVKKVYDNFWLVVVTNGIKKIPYEGFENMTIGVSVWGDHATDKQLRGNNKVDVFVKALKNYRDDPRAIWYYTTTPGNAHEIESVVRQCVENGNYVAFNFYGDLADLGGAYDHRAGFVRIRDEINRMIERYPDKIMVSSYMSEVVSTGRLYDELWSYDVCGSISADNPLNSARITNGNVFSPHFRAYNPDLTTRRCCVGSDRDCSTCVDLWAHTSWIMLNMKRHLGSKQEFTNWLTTMYLFYLMNRIVDFDAGVKLLPEIHRRTSVLQAHE